MREYLLTFPFKGEYHFISVTANQLANAVTTKTIDMPEFMVGDDNEDLNMTIHMNGEKYIVGFGYGDPSTVNVYEYEEDGGGFVIERNIPYLLTKITDNGAEIYNIGNDI